VQKIDLAGYRCYCIAQVKLAVSQKPERFMLPLFACKKSCPSAGLSNKPLVVTPELGPTILDAELN
jgi:hypothetical protein